MKIIKKFREHRLTKLAKAAFAQAAKAVIERAIQTGTPVILWENNAVKKVDPKELLQGSGKVRRSRRRRQAKT